MRPSIVLIFAVLLVGCLGEPFSLAPPLPDAGLAPSCNEPCARPPEDADIVTLWAGPGSPPACPDGSEVKWEGGWDTTSLAHTCTACTCGPSMGGVCAKEPVQVAAPVGMDCTLPYTVNGFLPPPGACTPVVMSPAGAEFMFHSSTVSPGFCAPSGGMASGVTPTWQTKARACSLVLGSGGCTAHEFCPSPLLGWSVCQAISGEMECPAGWRVKQVYSATINDLRLCSACSCSGAPGACTAKLSAYSDDACMTPIASGKFDASSGALGCFVVDAAKVGSISQTVDWKASDAGCSPSGGDPIGGATPGPITTFCCR